MSGAPKMCSVLTRHLTRLTMCAVALIDPLIRLHSLCLPSLKVVYNLCGNVWITHGHTVSHREIAICIAMRLVRLSPVAIITSAAWAGASGCYLCTHRSVVLHRGLAATAQSRRIENMIRALQRPNSNATVAPNTKPMAAVGSVAVKDIASALDDDTMEWVSTVHGGLANYLRALCGVVDGFRCFRLDKNRLGMDVVDVVPTTQVLPTQLGVVPVAPPQPSNTLQPQPTAVVVPPAPPPPELADWRPYEDVVQRLVLFGLLHNTAETAPTADPGSVVLPLHPGVLRFIQSDRVVYDALCPQGPPYPPRYVLPNAALLSKPLLDAMWTTHSTVPDYEAYRLARFLSTSEFKSIASLRGDPHVCAAVTTDPLLVALSYPRMFEMDDAALPTAIRFVLDATVVQRHLVGGKLDTHTVEELQELLAAKRRELRKGGTFKLIKVRKDIARAIQRKRFPKGSPLLDPVVLAYYVYDLLPPGEVVPLGALRDTLPLGVREQCGAFDVGCFERLPHLFVVGSDSSSADYSLRRVEVGEEVVSAPQELSDMDALALLCQSLPKKFDTTRPISVSTLLMRTPRPFLKAMRKWMHAGGMNRFPQVFRVDPTPNHELLLFIDADAMDTAVRERIG